MKLPKEIAKKANTRQPDEVYELIAMDCANQIPTNWCDPILTGPDAVIKNADCQQVDALLLAVKKRILARYGLLEPKT